jgi:cytochrome c biogenesis protein CcdA/thiol-disulfide isomerase/thioredoxin
MASFTIFTLGISYLVKIFPIDPNALRLLATVIIALLGLSLLIPALGARFEVLISRLLGPLQSKFKKEGTGLGAGLVTGFSLGLVWAPCAGPILATIATLSATQSVNIKVVAITLAYVLGLGIPLYIFSSFSAGLFKKMRAVNKYTGIIQQGFGLVMILTAILIYSNYALVLQARVLDLFPGYSRFLGQFENNGKLQKELDVLAGRDAQSIAEGSQKLLSDGGPAPDFAGANQWLNTKPLTMESLRGKVVLVDFWTYSCINCVRTLPHLTTWYERYKDKGLVIVGVHTPEFAFERETQNVQNALKQLGIAYPVVQDNDYLIWKNFKNHYWPAEYLIDAKGQLRHTHYGEGDYDRTEEAIRALLKESGHAVEGDLSKVEDQGIAQDRTAETYLGSDRIERFASPEKILGVDQVFSKPAALPLNSFAYEGTWNVKPQSAISGPKAALEFNVQAAKVFLVAGPAKAGSRIKVFVDGKPMEDIVLDSERLYDVIERKGPTNLSASKPFTLRLEFPDSGTSVYAFTFG